MGVQMLVLKKKMAIEIRHVCTVMSYIFPKSITSILGAIFAAEKSKRRYERGGRVKVNQFVPDWGVM